MMRVLREALDVAIPAAMIALGTFIASYAVLEHVYGKDEHVHDCTCIEEPEQEGAKQ